MASVQFRLPPLRTIRTRYSLVTRSPETIKTARTTASAGTPARPRRREAAAKEIAMTIWGSGQRRMAWWTLPPASAVMAICAQAIAMASRAKRMARRAWPGKCRNPGRCDFDGAVRQVGIVGLPVLPVEPAEEGAAGGGGSQKAAF